MIYIIHNIDYKIKAQIFKLVKESKILQTIPIPISKFSI